MSFAQLSLLVLLLVLGILAPPLSAEPCTKWSSSATGSALDSKCTCEGSKDDKKTCKVKQGIGDKAVFFCAEDKLSLDLDNSKDCKADFCNIKNSAKYKDDDLAEIKKGRVAVRADSVSEGCNDWCGAGNAGKPKAPEFKSSSGNKKVQTGPPYLGFKNVQQVKDGEWSDTRTLSGCMCAPTGNSGPVCKFRYTDKAAEWWYKLTYFELKTPCDKGDDACDDGNYGTGEDKKNKVAPCQLTSATYQCKDDDEKKKCTKDDSLKDDVDDDVKIVTGNKYCKIPRALSEMNDGTNCNCPYQLKKKWRKAPWKFKYSGENKVPTFSNMPPYPTSNRGYFCQSKSWWDRVASSDVLLDEAGAKKYIEPVCGPCKAKDDLCRCGSLYMKNAIGQGQECKCGDTAKCEAGNYCYLKVGKTKKSCTKDKMSDINSAMNRSVNVGGTNILLPVLICIIIAVLVGLAILWNFKQGGVCGVLNCFKKTVTGTVKGTAGSVKTVANPLGVK